MLEEHRVVLIRGTPASGKTILSKLLHAYYRDYEIKNGQGMAKKIPVVYFQSWETDGPDYETRIREAGLKAHQRGHEEYAGFNNDPDYIAYGDYLLIIDEGQMSYSDRGLWSVLIKSQHWQSGNPFGPRICIFAAYGSPGAGPEQERPVRTPLGSLDPAQRVSITRLSLTGSPEIALFYDEHELFDVIRRYSADDGTPRLQLNSAAQARVLYLTNGHPGAVSGLLGMLRQV